MLDSLSVLFMGRPYFFTGIFGLLFFFAAYAVAGPERHRMLVSGLFALSFSPAAFIYEQIYWTPVRLGMVRFGIEDLFYSFATGGLIWFMAARLFSSELRLEIHLFDLFKRYAVLASIGWATICGGLYIGMDPNTISVVAFAITLSIVLLLRWELWRLALVGACGYTIFYFFILKIYYLIWPDYILQWNPDNFWSQNILGVPLGEMTWTFFYSATHPVAAAYCFNARLISNDRAFPREGSAA